MPSLLRSPLSAGFLTFIVVFLTPLLVRAGATVDVTSSTASWTAILYPNNSPDPFNDQQTGSSEGDIVGNAMHASVYTSFGDAGTPSTTDGTIAFRVRLGADANPAGFKTALFIGIDGNGDGALDLFLGINNSGAHDTIGIWNPGNGLNTSPNTTTIVSTPLVSYNQTASNYSWTAVTTTNDPTVGTSTDLDGGGQPDYFLTFSIPFNDVVVQLAARGINGFTQNSTISYVISTATQANSLNQDLNGVDKNFDPAATWSSLGVVSNPISSAGIYAIPEAPVSLLFAVGILVCAGFVKANQTRSAAEKVALLVLFSPMA